MKYFQARFDIVVMRFYLTIAIAVVAFFANIPWLALLCLPVFLSAILAVKFDARKTPVVSRQSMIKVEKEARQAA